MKDNYQELLKKMENEEGFFKNNNMHVVEATLDSCIIQCDLVTNSMNPYGFAHGGLIFGLGDTVMGMMARRNGRSAVTLSANISYLRPGVGKYLKASAEVIKDGKNVIVLRANIYNDQDKLVATMDSNYAYID